MTGDGLPDAVRYEWSGTPGDPLPRTLNGGDPAIVAAGVQEFVLTYGVRNTPESLAGYWKTDFDADPRAADANRDGVGDWIEQAGTLNATRVAGRVWTASAADGVTLRTNPAADFDTLTTVEVRCRCATANPAGNGAETRLCVDRSGGSGGVVVASVRLESDGTQTARVFVKPDDATDTLVCEAAGLGTGFVDLRLVVAPRADVVGVWVNGVWKATATYPTYSIGAVASCTLGPAGGDAEFDSVSVRVSP